MPKTILKAHFDGKQIVLDEPFDLPINIPLMVAVLDSDGEREAWTALCSQSLAGAYSDQEPEYSQMDLRPE